MEIKLIYKSKKGEFNFRKCGDPYGFSINDKIYWFKTDLTGGGVKFLPVPKEQADKLVKEVTESNFFKEEYESICC